jgi:transketolase
MRWAWRWPKSSGREFNRDGHAIVDHHTYVFLGDGCLMEGISHEACALAGAWKLNKLIALYDDNGISIDGQVQPWFIDNTALRFAAYGWNVIGPIDGHDVDAVDRAIADAKNKADGPRSSSARPTSARAAPTAPTRQGPWRAAGRGGNQAHPRGPGLEPWPVRSARPSVYADWDAKAAARRRSRLGRALCRLQGRPPRTGREFVRRMKGDLPKDFAQVAVDAAVGAHAKAETVASRKASQLALEAFTAALPEMLGGSADLTGSNLTNTKATPALRFDLAGEVKLTEDGKIGRHINFGVREFGMAAIMNGVALHGGYIPYGGTFLTFSDYSRNAIRMAALMKQRVVHVFTHDSIGLGEDGPTHQSIEHAASLRLIPNLDVWRPADTAETAVAWAVALQNKAKPTALLLSRQNLPYAPKRDLGDISRGAYVLSEPPTWAQEESPGRDHCHRLRSATGAEGAGAAGRAKIAVRVVSMPSTTTFDRQTVAYKSQRAACRRAARCRGNGLHRRLVEIRLRRRGGHRHLWRVGPGAGAVQALRLHARERGRHRACRAAQIRVSSSRRNQTMTIKVGINGFGRIGRNVLRSAVQNFPDIEIVGINDLLEPDYLAYMLQYDSVHGRFKGTVSVEGNTLIVNGKKIRLTQERDPANLKWNEVGADVVIESTGLFLDKVTGAKAPGRRRQEGHPVGPFQGRHADVRVMA